MPLDAEVSTARKKIFRDGYDMSFGEIASLYERGELVISPEYQRLFRWDAAKKTRFLESLLLNIPIPPIFVFSDHSGKWELVDGLQRVSTVLEFMGLLKGPNERVTPRFVCDGTALLPSLENVSWPTDEDDPGDGTKLSPSLQVGIRRSRIRVEILGQETDPQVKYELFQRLNTGGAILSEQEIRNVIVIALNQTVAEHVVQMSQHEPFVALTPVGKERVNRQYRLELVTRFLVLRNFPYQNGMDVHYYLDQGMVNISREEEFDWPAEISVFDLTMSRLVEAVGSGAFKKSNRFSLALFEFISLGLSRALEERPNEVTDDYIRRKVAAVANLPQMAQYSGMGVRGTQRLAGLVMPLAEAHFRQ
jgi:hypothetical protein